MGLEAAVTVDDPAACPVADAAAETGAAIGSVTRSSSVGDSVIEEFELDSNATSPEGMEPVFEDDRHSVYRFERDGNEACICERIETFGCAVADIRAIDGRLRIVFRPDDVETLREIIEALRESAGGVHLEHLVQSSDPSEGDTVVVDRGRLTDRQREVLETAYEMGYFDHPKGANAQEVAAALSINSATLRGHLAAAQSKLLEEILAG